MQKYAINEKFDLIKINEVIKMRTSLWALFSILVWSYSHKYAEDPIS